MPTCSDIKNAFYALTGQVSTLLYNRSSNRDPWVGYVEKGEWPEGMGWTINSMMLERTLTDSETGTEWTAASPSGSGDTATQNNNCLPTPEVLKFGQTITPFTMSRRNIQTEDFCINDQPIVPLFTDSTTSRDLIRQDPELRMDFRYADPDKLINTLGTPYSYNGFKHVWIKFPPRYDTAGNRVYPYTAPTGTTKGWKRTINTAYLYAPYQVSFVFIPTVFTCLYERPSTNPGGALKFDYASHMGEFQFLVIRDKNCNPRG